MRQNHETRLLPVCGSIAVVGALGYWSAVLYHANVTGLWGHSVQARGHRIMVRGAAFPRQLLPEPVLTARGTLLMMVSDDCVYCREEVPSWIASIRSGALRPTVPVAILRGPGLRLATELHSVLSGVRVETSIHEVSRSDARLLKAAVGLAGTPSVVLLDNGSIVRFASGRLNERTLPVLRGELKALAQ